MSPMERAGLLAHAESAAYLRRVEEARAVITEGLRRCERPFVGYSGGKDSGALLWLVWEQAPQVPAWCLTGGETRWLHSDLPEVMAWWRERFPASDIEEVLVDTVTTADLDWLGTYWAVAGRESPWSKHLHSRGVDGVFLGIRRDESPTRRRSLCRYREDGLPIYRWCEGRGDEQAGHLRICPLDRWTVADVGALHVSAGLPLLRAYQVDGLEARTHTRLGRTAIRLGAVDDLRRRDPAGYHDLIARFPELRQ